jgi:hypothetical protein
MKTDDQKIEEVLLVLDLHGAWIKGFAQEYNLTAEELMNAAKRWVDHEEMFRDARVDFGEIPEEFWEHYQAVAGRDVPKENRGSFFACCT